MNVKLKGLVIRESPNGESGKLITLLTDTHGVISVGAKGVRKLSAAYLRSAQMFAFSEFLLYEKNGFYTVTEASLCEDFYSLRRDITVLSLAQYFCQAAAAFAIPGEEGGEILRLLLNCLYALCNKDIDRGIVKAAFELRLCAVSGFAPELGVCCNCGSDISGECLLDINDGGAECAGCASVGASGVLLTQPVRLAMEHILRSDIKKILSFRIGQNDTALLSDTAERYFLARAETGFSALSFYKQCEELK